MLDLTKMLHHGLLLSPGNPHGPISPNAPVSLASPGQHCGPMSAAGPAYTMQSSCSLWERHLTGT